MLIFNKKIWIPSIFVFSLIITGTSQAADIDNALKDLSEATGQSIATQAQAGEVCDSEKFFTVCAEIGKKYNLYNKEEVKQVDSLVSEIKGQIESELKQCQTTECLIGVAQKLSQKVSAKNPKLAEQAELSPKFIQKKREMVEVAKEKDREFKEAIKSGSLQCGDGTTEGCGNFCLNPGAEAKAQGGSAIPSVCREIAKKFFGSEGEKELESAYGRVGQVRSSYLRKAENLTFETIDGQTITDPEQIGRYMEEQGRQGNVEAIEKGMDFMVNNGFVQPEEKEYALKFVRQARGQGGRVDFDSCSKDPAACRDFVPQELRKEFETQLKVKEIITQETGFDPSQCGSGDPSVGQKCFEGAKKALEKLKSLQGEFPDAQGIIGDLQQKVSRQEEFQGKQEELRQVFEQGGGPGGCRSEEECRSFCSNSTNGQECFSFGSKQGISGFHGEEGQERFQQFNQQQNNFQRPSGGGFSPSGRSPEGGQRPPPPSSLVDTPLFGGVFRALIRISN